MLPSDDARLRRRERHERYLSEGTAALSSSLDYEATLRTLAGLLVPDLADWCSVILLEDDALKNVAITHVNEAKALVAREVFAKYPPKRELMRGIWHVILKGESQLFESIDDAILRQGAHDEEHFRMLRDVGLESAIAVPIRAGTRILGSLSVVLGGSGRRYDTTDLSLVEELGRRAGIAIENARLFEAERTARERLALIAQVGEELWGAADYESMLRTVAQITLPALGDWAIFDVVEGREVRRVVAAHDDAAIEEILTGTTFHPNLHNTDMNLSALSTGTSALHRDIDDEWIAAAARDQEHADVLTRIGVRSMILVPLRMRNEVLGSLTLGYGKSGRRHTQEDMRLAEELARRASMAMTQIRLFEEAQEAARHAEEASRIKDEFLATVSHELRTPLNAIVGWSSLLRDRNTDPALTKGIDVIHRNAQAQVKIIEDILDVSRIITGKLRLDPKPSDVVAIVRDAIEVVRPSATAKDIAIAFAPPAELSLAIVDPERLRQVVWNLLSNATKFTDAGGTITIGLRQADAQIVVSVEDTGLGIAPDFLPFVFDRFKQADSSTTRRVGGLGLGLALVRHIVELHGGKVEAVSSGLGHGSTFTLRLPVRAVATGAPSPVRERTTPTSQRSLPVSLDGLRLLVVDDEPDARDLLRMVLVDAGGTVEVAGSVREALLSVERFHPDVLVSDIGMPGEDGYALIERVRSDGFTGPAIALTAYTRAEDKMRALAAGFTTHLAKPVDPSEFLRVVVNLGQMPR